MKEVPLEVFEHQFFLQNRKNEWGPFGDIEKICEKKSHKAEKPAQKIFWSRMGLEPTFFCLADLKKAVFSKPSAGKSSVAQFSVSASQLIKLIKSVSSLVSKSHCYSLRSLRKAPTKNCNIPIEKTSKISGFTCVALGEITMSLEILESEWFIER